MPITYDVTTDAGKVRLIITDRTDATAIFTDAEIDAFLEMETSIKRAAALALETIATNEVLVQKRIKTLDLQTDGPAEAAALLKLAASLREQDDAADGGFDIAEMVFDPFGTQERLWKQWQRGEL